VASFTFYASSRWQEGTHNIGEIGRFVHAGHEDQTRDEPLVLLGNNKGPNAVELLLQAVGFCYAVGHVANAAARGIEVTQMEYDIEGDVDVRTFLGLAGPRAGFTASGSPAGWRVRTRPTSSFRSCAPTCRTPPPCWTPWPTRSR